MFPVRADYAQGVKAYQDADYDRAFEEWLKVARSPAGEVDPAQRAESVYALGMLCWIGQGVVQDTAAAAYWLRQAAELNHAGAQTKLGYLYSSGQGVAQSDFEAYKWFQMAARQGDADAQYNLGVIYREGHGVTANGTEALKWFREAASNGDAESARIVSQYEAGVPVTGAAGGTDPQPDGPLSAPESFPARNDSSRSEVVEPGQPSGDAAWIARREPEHYTIQIIALRDQTALQSIIGSYPEWSPWAIYQQTLKGRPLWVLVQGDYADVTAARAAVQKMPARIQKRENMWIRRFAMVQGLLQ